MKDMIGQRSSCRSYTGISVDADMIEKIMSTKLVPLYPDIQVRWDIVSRDKVKCICPWTTPQLITVYSEEKEGYLENAGFLFQQMDLMLQKLGLGVCWLGMGKMNPKTAEQVPGMKYTIMLAFGNPKGNPLRGKAGDFKRKTLAQIADREDPKLEPARLAPSSINSQPWYFVHEGDAIHAYCVKKNELGYMNRIDMGIALAHLYVANEETFRFFVAQNPPQLPGYGYVGSVTL